MSDKVDYKARAAEVGIDAPKWWYKFNRSKFFNDISAEATATVYMAQFWAGLEILGFTTVCCVASLLWPWLNISAFTVLGFVAAYTLTRRIIANLLFRKGHKNTIDLYFYRKKSIEAVFVKVREASLTQMADSEEIDTNKPESVKDVLH